MQEYIWNPWHGCKKYSDGCLNCYVYRRDESVGRDASVVRKNSDFDLPLKKKRNGEYRIDAGSTVFLCMTSDFFLDKADIWRNDIWNIIKIRNDLNFIIITKRILRFEECKPIDWDDGYNNVAIGMTIENQRECNRRFPVFNTLKIKKKFIICEPLLTAIDMSAYLDKSILQVVVGGESGNMARLCNFEWVMQIRNQCIAANIPFYFKQTGANFKKDGKIYKIKRKFQHIQAKKADIDIKGSSLWT